MATLPENPIIGAVYVYMMLEVITDNKRSIVRKKYNFEIQLK